MAGYIQKRGNGTFRLIVTSGRDTEGKPIRYSKTVHVATRKEADKLMALYVAEIESIKNQPPPEPEPDKLTFEAFATQWLAYSKGRLTPKTYCRYESCLKTRIYGAIGQLDIKEIKPTHLRDFYADLQQAPNVSPGRSGRLASRTIIHHHRLIHTILQTAYMWDVIVNNPAAKVKPPRAESPEIAVYTEDEVALLLAAVEKELLIKKVQLWLAVTTGARLGEIMGLKWTDFNKEKSTVYIQRSAQFITNVGSVCKEPKTKTGKRVLALPASMMKLLEEWRAHCIENNVYADHLFVHTDGSLMYPTQMTRWFPLFLKRHKLRKISFHGLRHTHITLAIAAGFPLKNVSTRAGHSTIAITCDIYAVPVTAVDVDIANSFEKLLSGS